jgi:hypothetical protein
MQTNTFNAATKLAAFRGAGEVLRVQGYYKAAADAWLQIHDSLGEPAAGAVPVKSYTLSYNSPYSWGFDPGTLHLTNGCYVAVSSTEGTYTTVAYSAGTTYADIEVDYGPYDRIPSDVSAAGDFATGNDSQVIWLNSAGAKRLYLAKFKNNDAETRYLMLFASSAVVDGDAPLMQWAVVAGATITLSFGIDGFIPKAKSSAGAQTLGCQFVSSTTTGVLAATSSSVSLFIGYYK